MNNTLTKPTDLPLIAILRGVKPSEILAVADILIEEGFSKIEVPLNSPDALKSISLLVERFADDYLIGAGTVTSGALAKEVIATGANLVVTPNYNEEVVKSSIAAGCKCYPGIVTPTEAFNALAAGATGLKIFPVSALGLDGFKALMSVLPAETACYPVGGIDPTEESMYPYLSAGARGFGLGSSLYKPSMTPEQIRSNTRRFVETFLQFSQR